MAKEVVKAAGTSLAAAETMSMFESHAGAGLQNVTSKDILIPRIQILQGLSPQVIPSKPNYIKGAVVGQICDVGLGELFDGSIDFIPVYFVKQWLEWAPRATQKGLVAIHDSEKVMDKAEARDPEKPRRFTLANGNLIEETHQFYGINLTAGGRKSFIPMKSSQIKKARLINTWAMDERVRRADGSEFNPPIWYRAIKLGTVAETNADGDWVGWKPERGERIQDLPDFKRLYDEIISFQDALTAGTVKGDLSGLDEEGGGGGGSSSGADQDGAM
jgi:hypothetical protein